MPATVQVQSWTEWVETPVVVKAGDSLNFRAEGRWVDFVISCTADGYDAAFFYAIHVFPRIPDEGRYFRLMGRISIEGIRPTADDPALSFPIGAALNGWRAPVGGRLYVFANDRLGFYWNNWGTVTLTIY